MDYYYKEFEKLQEEFHDVMHHFPLFQEMIDEIYEKDIKEINDLLEQNDEFYLKKAISKLKNVIQFIQNTSTEIDDNYKKFDMLASSWEKKELVNIYPKDLERINSQVNKANELIKSHHINDIKEANKIIEKLLSI